MANYDISVITPTTGRNSLYFLIDSLKNQNVPINHIILWDNKREDKFLYPDNTTLVTSKPSDLDVDSEMYKSTNIVVRENVNSNWIVPSYLRSIGLIMATTNFVTFADDDIIWEPEHATTMLNSVKDSKWCFCKRKIWTKIENEQYEYIGVDDFESVGEEAKTSYKSVDNNCMMFMRKFGTSASCIYRETKENNDNKLMYDFLLKYAGNPSKTNQYTINQVCPQRLVGFFKENCT